MIKIKIACLKFEKLGPNLHLKNPPKLLDMSKLRLEVLLEKNELNNID
jgi:hypothetical protein